MSVLTSYRPSSRRTLLGPAIAERKIIAPDASDYSDGIWWDWTDPTRSLVQPTGSQTITYGERPYRYMSVDDIQNVATADYVGMVVPASISVGDTWRCRIKQYADPVWFLMAGLLMSDGTSTSSNLKTVFGYPNNGTPFLVATWDGAFEALSHDANDTSLGGDVRTRRSEHIYELSYTAANTFVGRVLYDSTEGLVELFTSGSTTFTLTPTHIGVGWSNWGKGTSHTIAHVEFGPVYRA